MFIQPGHRKPSPTPQSSHLDLPQDCATGQLAAESRNRERLESLHAWAVAELHPDDLLRRELRAALLASRALCWRWADFLPKGSYRQWARRAEDWPRL